MEFILNPIVISVVVLCALCLARVNVLLALIAASLVAGLTGGLGPVYREFLPQDTQRSIIPAQADPIDGAIALARDFQAELAN